MPPTMNIEASIGRANSLLTVMAQSNTFREVRSRGCMSSDPDGGPSPS